MKELISKIITTTCYIEDERILLHDGRLCTTKTPYRNNHPCGPTEYIDVTEEVLNIICGELNKAIKYK